MKARIYILLLLWLPLRVTAQETRLQFDPEGEFKIAQFNITHFYKDGPRSPQVGWFARTNQAWLEKKRYST